MRARRGRRARPAACERSRARGARGSRPLRSRSRRDRPLPPTAPRRPSRRARRRSPPRRPRGGAESTTCRGRPGSASRPPCATSRPVRLDHVPAMWPFSPRQVRASSQCEITPRSCHAIGGFATDVDGAETQGACAVSSAARRSSTALAPASPPSARAHDSASPRSARSSAISSPGGAPSRSSASMRSSRSRIALDSSIAVHGRAGPVAEGSRLRAVSVSDLGASPSMGSFLVRHGSPSKGRP